MGRFHSPVRLTLEHLGPCEDFETPLTHQRGYVLDRGTLDGERVVLVQFGAVQRLLPATAVVLVSWDRPHARGTDDPELWALRFRPGQEDDHAHEEALAEEKDRNRRAGWEKRRQRRAEKLMAQMERARVQLLELAR